MKIYFFSLCMHSNWNKPKCWKKVVSARRVTFLENSVSLVYRPRAKNSISFGPGWKPKIPFRLAAMILSLSLSLSPAAPKSTTMAFLRRKLTAQFQFLFIPPTSIQSTKKLIPDIKQPIEIALIVRELFYLIFFLSKKIIRCGWCRWWRKKNIRGGKRGVWIYE